MLGLESKSRCKASSEKTLWLFSLRLLSPDGSYTEDNSAELHFKSRSSEFDDDFDDEEPLPSIGTCKSLYPFQGLIFTPPRLCNWPHLFLCGSNLLFSRLLRSERRHSVHGGGGTTFCGGRGQRWRLDPSTEEPGGGGIRPHLLHQSLPRQQCQRCHDLHITYIRPSHDLHMTRIIDLWP